MALRPWGLEAVAVVAAFTVLTLGLLDPLPAHMHRYLAGGLEDPLLNTWVLAWDADRLRHGFAGLWDPPVFYPYKGTLAYSEHLLGIAVPLAPLQWITGNPVLVYNLGVLLSFVLAGSGMYLLVRSLTGRPDAAFVAGVIFAFCPYRWVQIAHLQVLMSGWMPIGLWALHRYVDTGSSRTFAVLTAAFILQGLSNGYFLYFAALVLGLAGAYELYVHRPAWKRTVSHLAIGAAVVAAVFLPITRAYTRAGLTRSWGHSEGEVLYHSATLTSYLSVTPEIRAWSWLPFRSHPEAALFPGLIALLLAVLAVWPSGWRNSQRRRLSLYVTIACVAVILSFGPRPSFWPFGMAWPYGWLVELVPGFSALRVPARMGTVFLLALAVLAGFGAARLLRRFPTPASGFLAAVLGASIVIEGYGGKVGIEPFRHTRGSDERALHARLLLGPPGGAIELPMQSVLMIPSRSDLHYQYNTLFHGRPIVNGSSRYEPPLTSFLKGAVSPMREITQLPDLPRMFREIGLRYVVIRPADFRFPDIAEATLHAFASSTDSVAHEAFETGRSPIHLFELGPPPNPATGTGDARRKLPGSAYSATASHNPERLASALDGDVSTRWMSGSAQTGDETLDIVFDRHRDIARIRLEMGASHGEYPRGLAVTALEGEGARELFAGSILPHLARAILADPDRIPIDVELPPNHSQHLRLRQTGVTRTLNWTIHELSFWER